MKIRDGFVSNSSSSSFIIKIDPEKLKSIESDNIDEIDSLRTDGDDWYSDETYEKIVKRRGDLRKFIDDGGIVLSMTVDSGDEEGFTDLLKRLGAEYEDEWS